MDKFDASYLYNTSFSWLSCRDRYTIITLIMLQEHFCSHDFTAASAFKHHDECFYVCPYNAQHTTNKSTFLNLCIMCADV